MSKNKLPKMKDKWQGNFKNASNNQYKS